MQTGHLGNLTRMWNENIAPFAGPLGDNGFIRGIVIVKVPNMSALKEQFKTDPFVQNNYLSVQAVPVVGNWDVVVKPEGDFKLMRCTLAIVKKGRNWNSWDKEWHDSHNLSIRKWLDSGKLKVWATATDQGNIRSCLFFNSSDGREVQSWLADDPAVKSGYYTFETHPQFLQDGIFGK